MDDAPLLMLVMPERGIGALRAPSIDARHQLCCPGARRGAAPHHHPGSCGLLLPVWAPDGTNGLDVYRPDAARLRKDGHALKCELPAGVVPRLDVPPRCRPQLRDPAVRLWITEGQEKGDALASRGLCAVALLGVWLFNDRHGLLPDLDLVAWKGREVAVVFDSDVMRKTQVREVLDRLTAHLARKGAAVTPVALPEGPDGEKTGVDDSLRTHPLEDLEALVGKPGPAPTGTTRRGRRERCAREVTPEGGSSPHS